MSSSQRFFLQLKVPEDMFSDASQVLPFASSSAGSSSTLLVCKSWQRVATPFLYSVLGRFVKQLRVKGGFGNFMRDILQNTPNVTDIFLSLQIHSSDSSSGLVLGLPLINPTRLIVFDNPKLCLKNKAVLQLMSTLETCVPKWNKLNAVNLPINGPAPAYNAPIRAPNDPFFRLVESAPQASADRIWSRILFFAILSLEQHPEKTPSWNLPDRRVNSGRLQFLFVSKSYRLARPYLYYYAVFYDRGNFPSFSRALSVQLLGQHIREIDVRQDGRLPFYARRRTLLSTTTLPSILPNTSNLTHLLGGYESISWAGFPALATSAGSTLQEFFRTSFEADTTDRSPTIFRHYIALRAFTWEYKSSPLNVLRRKSAPFFGALHEVSAGMLPALEFLDIKSTEALSVFSKMDLPNLRRATFELRGDWDIPFLKTHGTKLYDLHTRSATISTQSVLTLYPNITTLTMAT
ncbi:hypothetical protein DFH09DRAFT_1491162 [Mycena vulgaris]|nr:hypothetical protein DFH09DRAFT_1491162 [Mycena vulgaris]